jgi:hypothetical protein
MAYYKIRLELWCDFDPKGTSLDEIVEHTHTGDAVCIGQEVVSVVDRPQDIEDDDAMKFFGGEEGDADQSQG